jgi:hypothetical protein
MTIFRRVGGSRIHKIKVDSSVELPKIKRTTDNLRDLLFLCFENLGSKLFYQIL